MWHGSDIEYSDGRINNICDITAFQTSKGTAAILFQDITYKKQVENRLKESEEKYRKLVDNSNVGVFRTTLNGELLLLMTQAGGYWSIPA